MRNLKMRLFAIALLTIAAVPSAFAAAMGNYLENKLVDSIFRARAFSPPTTLCAALTTTAPNDASTGATIVEANYAGYARAPLSASSTNWKGTSGETTAVDSAGAGGTTSNAVVMTFGGPATSGPTVVTSVVLLDSCTIGAGNVLFYAPLNSPQTINNGAPAPTYAIDALQWQIDN